MPPTIAKPSLEQQKVGFRPLISSAISRVPSQLAGWGRFAGAHTAPYRTAEQTCSLFQDTPITTKVQSHLGKIARHSGAAPRVVILAQPRESSFWRSQNLRSCSFPCPCSSEGTQGFSPGPFSRKIIPPKTSAKSLVKPLSPPKSL
jgi:hypothetical protein